MRVLESRLRARSRTVLRWLLVGLVSLALQQGSTALESSSLLRGTPNDAQRVVLPGNVHPMAQARFDVGAVPASLPMLELQLILRRSPAQDAALKQFLEAQQTPGSPQYHQWLTPSQFGARFGASDRDVQAASSWLLTHGFKVADLPAGRGTLPFSGTAAQVEAAFQTPIHYFLVNGVKHFANTANPKVPAAFQALVSGVIGLHDFRVKSNLRSRSVTHPATVLAGGGDAVAPQDFAIIYNLVPLLSGAGAATGAGITVAVAAQSDIDTSIPASYWAGFGVTQGQTVTVQPVSSASDPGRTNDSDESEAYLDAEIIGGLARNAKIVLVSDTSATSAAQYVISHNLAAILSISFSECESALGSANAQISTMFSQAAAEGITVVVSSGDSGIAECDDNIEGTAGQTVVSGLSVNGLGSTPYNISVGGTDFNPVLVAQGSYWNSTNHSGTYASAKSYIPEMVWNSSCANPITASATSVSALLTYCNDSANASSLQIEGAGGGVSSCVTSNSSGVCTAGYAQPSWQSGVDGLQSLTTRAIPDVSLLANNWIFCNQSDTSCGSSGFHVAFGTSAAAPAMSAIVAMLDQSLKTSGNPDGRQGNLNPMLYRLAAAEYGTSTSPNSASLTSCNANKGANVGSSCVFHDVTSGSNGQPCSVSNFSASKSRPTSTCIASSGDTHGIVGNGSTESYQAAAGYDLASGLGSINAANLLQAVNNVQGPTGLTATASGTTVTLSWNAVANATNYNVYVGTASGAESNTAQPTGSTTATATVGSLGAGGTYFFYITAVTSAGTSLPSNEASVTLVPAAPTGLSTTGSATTITLTWNASSGATRYQVLQGSAAGAESTTPVASATAATYSVTAAAGTTDYFKVVAVNQGGNSAASSEVSGTVLPQVPGGVIATGGNASVTLSWSAAAGAVSYNIYLGTAAGAEATSPVQSQITSTSATLGNLTNGTTYYFVVKSVNAVGTSAASSETSATTVAPAASGHGGGSLGLAELSLLLALIARRLVPGRVALAARLE